MNECMVRLNSMQVISKLRASCVIYDSLRRWSGLAHTVGSIRWPPGAVVNLALDPSVHKLFGKQVKSIATD